MAKSDLCFRYSSDMLAEKAIAALILMAILVCLVEARGSSDHESFISAGSILSASQTDINATWKSSSGKFAFGFYQERSNFAIGIQFFLNSSFSTVIWTADHDLPLISASATLTFGYEGLVLHVDEGDRTISDLYDGTFQFASASMLDSGNFVIYDMYDDIAWESFNHPTDTLMAGQISQFDGNLISSVDSENNHSSGRFQFSMQDGKAALYPLNTLTTVTNAYWTFGDDTKNGLFVDYRGNLNFSIDYSSQDPGLMRFLRIEADGFLRIYSITQSGLMTVSKQYPPGEDKCSVMGTCGLNSYCDSTKGVVFCFCFPGYVYIDPSREFVGCQRNFSMGTCEAHSAGTSKSSLNNNIRRVPNIIWSDDSYSNLQVKSEDECSKACSGDCDCHAALFFPSKKRCGKQRHPFMYGKALFGKGESTVAFLKVPTTELKNRTIAESISIGNLSVLGARPLILSLLLTAIFAVMLDFFIFFACRYRIRMYRRLCESMEPLLEKAMAPRFFSYRQIEQATNGFKEEIGEGKYGKVFKGLLPSPSRDAGMPIAVKKLTSVPSKVEENFRNELKSTGRIHHRNVVRLLGFCQERSNWILVYEYMSCGSLADLIFNSNINIVPPSWKQRVNIALDVARGLCYLHEGCDNAIIHGDIKPENIFIGDNYRAKIGDLGLAKHLRPDKHVTYTRERGTSKYMAPEWKNPNGCVSTKVDVVSFGVLLLELIFLKEYQQVEGLDGEYNLASWAYKCLEGKCQWQFPGEDVDVEELEVMVKVALWCFPGSPTERLSMYDVVMMLGRKKVVEFPPVPLVDWYVPAESRTKEKN